jgi:hypothetical protein
MEIEGGRHRKGFNSFAVLATFFEYLKNNLFIFLTISYKLLFRDAK